MNAIQFVDGLEASADFKTSLLSQSHALSEGGQGEPRIFLVTDSRRFQSPGSPSVSETFAHTSPSNGKFILAHFSLPCLNNIRVDAQRPSYRGSSLIRKSLFLRPYGGAMPRALRWPLLDGHFLMSGVLLYLDGLGFVERAGRLENLAQREPIHDFQDDPEHLPVRRVPRLVKRHHVHAVDPSQQ